jgi:hypothetical protein
MIDKPVPAVAPPLTERPTPDALALTETPVAALVILRPVLMTDDSSPMTIPLPVVEPLTTIPS